MPGLTLPATSATGPEAIWTAFPSVALERVKDAWVGSARPEPESLAAKPAVWVPRHQPLLPGTLHASAAELWMTAGAVLSTRIDLVWTASALPALSKARNSSVVVPSALTTKGPP